MFKVNTNTQHTFVYSKFRQRTESLRKMNYLRQALLKSICIWSEIHLTLVWVQHNELQRTIAIYTYMTKAMSLQNGNQAI